MSLLDSKFYIVLAICLSILSGCNRRQSWQAKTHAVSGKLTVNGEPAEGAIVTLLSAGNPIDIRESRPTAWVKNDGTFQLGTYRGNDGAPAGEYVVSITWPISPSGIRPIDRLKGKFAGQDNRLPTVKIERGNNILPPFELKNVDLLRAGSTTTKQSN